MPHRKWEGVGSCEQSPVPDFEIAVDRDSRSRLKAQAAGDMGKAARSCSAVGCDPQGQMRQAYSQLDQKKIVTLDHLNVFVSGFC